MTESFNAGDTVFYKRSPDHYLQCSSGWPNRDPHRAFGGGLVPSFFLGSTRRTFSRASLGK